MTHLLADRSQRHAAKVAGLAYLLTLAIVVVANYGVIFRLVVKDNIAETARNIMANDWLFRLNIAGDLIYGAGIFVLLTALYTVLRPVSRTLALLAAMFRLVYAFMWIIIALCLLGVLRLLSDTEVVGVFEADQLHALMELYLGVGSGAYTIGLLFWGLGSAICAFLLFRSSYIPRALAAWGVISSAWCAVCALGVVTVPNFAKVIHPGWFDMPMLTFEIGTALWFLFKGLSSSGMTEPNGAGGGL